MSERKMMSRAKMLKTVAQLCQLLSDKSKAMAIEGDQDLARTYKNYLAAVVQMVCMTTEEHEHARLLRMKL